MKTTLGLFCSVFLICAPAAAQTVVTCGQRVTQGTLAADMDCSGTTGFAVIVEPEGSLDLAGHSIISGNAPEAESGGAVFCEGNCTIAGGDGEISSSLPFDWRLESRNLPAGVVCPYPRQGEVSISQLTISGYAEGANADVLRAHHVTAVGNHVALNGRRLRVSGSTLTANDQAIAAFRVSLRNATVTDNHFGMVVRRAVVRRSTVSGQADFGINASDGARVGRLTASDSSIDGNCVNTLSDQCWDFATSGGKPPILDNVTCSRSGRFILRTQMWDTWHLCTLD